MKPENVVPLADYFWPCIRWALVMFATARQAAEQGDEAMAARYRAIAEGIFDRLERQA